MEKLVNNGILDRPRVQPHPLRDAYMVCHPFGYIPPYFGTKRECEKARNFLENKLLSMGYKFKD